MTFGDAAGVESLTHHHGARSQLVTNSKYAAFVALDPFFDIVMQGLAGAVDGDHYFEAIANDAVFEYRYVFPGFPTKVKGRDALMALYAGYGDSTVLHRAHATTPEYAEACRRRKKVEMLFAHLKRILHLTRLRLRGPNGANDEFLLAATAQNLRRLARLRPMKMLPEMLAA
jgi:hypothetical protein